MYIVDGSIGKFIPNPAIQHFGFFCTRHDMFNATCPLTISLTKAFASCNVSGLKGFFFFPGYIELFVHSESQECIVINTRFDVD